MVVPTAFTQQGQGGTRTVKRGTRTVKRGATLGRATAFVGLAACATLGLAGVSWAGPPTLYVSVRAKATASGTSCTTAKYSSVRAAVAVAPLGATVVVCGGTYGGQVTVPKPLTLVGEHATILAAGADNGFLVPASGVTIEGFTVKGAIGEGITTRLSTTSSTAASPSQATRPRASPTASWTL